MKNSLPIGRVAGISLFIHWTFPIIIIWVIFMNYRQGQNITQITWSIVFILVLFVCVTLHELGHALAARKFNIKTSDITLLPIGGVARLENMPQNPKIELVVAIAGPIVNVGIFLLIYLYFIFSGYPFPFTQLVQISGEQFFYNLALVNLWVALFNLIPAFPMDGGRVLRAFLSMILNRVHANKIALSIGQAIALVFVVSGVMYNPFLILIGLYVFYGAGAETNLEQTHSLLEDHTTEEACMKQFSVLQKTDKMQHAVQLLLNGTEKNFMVLDERRPYGILSREGIIRALSTKGMEEPVSSACNHDIIFIAADEPLEHALKLLQEKKHYLLIVIKDDQVFGVIDKENILEFIMVNNALDDHQQ